MHLESLTFYLLFLSQFFKSLCLRKPPNMTEETQLMSLIQLYSWPESIHIDRRPQQVFKEELGIKQANEACKSKELNQQLVSLIKISSRDINVSTTICTSPNIIQMAAMPAHCFLQTRLAVRGNRQRFNSRDQVNIYRKWSLAN